MINLVEWLTLCAQSEIRRTGTVSLTTTMQLTRLGADADAIEKDYKK